MIFGVHGSSGANLVLDLIPAQEIERFASHPEAGFLRLSLDSSAGRGAATGWR
ncbi:MAG: hypothetical protein ACKO45_00665 [Cyanobium sp.]